MRLNGVLGAVFFVSGLVTAGMAAGQDKGDKVSSSLDLSSLEACKVAPDEGESLTCACTGGEVKGSVWGIGPFTGDSNICAAAQFAGILPPEGGAVYVKGVPGLDAYEAGTANGITTGKWGAYSLSFTVTAAGAKTAGTASFSDLPACGRLPADVQTLACSCSADAAGSSVWGSDPYTADSAICAAARHAGLLAAGSGGIVNVLRVPGLDAYRGSVSNGVESRDWGAYASSITFNRNE